MSLPRAGDVVASKYAIDGVIGRGGFATVYRATDRSVGRAVALKVVDTASDPTIVGRFKREARVLASLSDPHTLRLFDFGVDQGLMYMVFELLGGLDLSNYLRAHGTMSQAETIHVLMQILSSLREAHSAGLLHRDIKPSNIRIFEYNGDPLYVKVMDFGIARSFASVDDSVTRTGHAVGTPRYMAPEQLIGTDLTPASDLFSVALVVLEMMTGDPRAALEQAYAGRGLQIPNASWQFTTLISRMTAVSAENRPQTVDAVVQALQRVDDVVSIPTPGANPTPISANITPNHAPRARAPAMTTHETSVEIEESTTRLALVVLAVVIGLAISGLIVVLVVKKPDPPPSVVEYERKGADDLIIEPAGGAGVAEVEPESGPPDVPDVPDIEVAVPVTERPTGCGTSIAPGRYRRSSILAWELYVPRSYNPDQRTPLLLALHGSGGAPRDLIDDVGMREWADREQILIVAPYSAGWTFEGMAPEVVEDAIQQTLASLCVDESQVFGLGYDTGGWMMHLLDCRGWFAATSTSSYRNAGAVACDNATPHIVFTPDNSKHLPIDGDRQCVGLKLGSLDEYEQQLRTYKGLNGAVAKPYKTRGKGTCKLWEGETALVSCLVEGGHGWHGMRPRSFDVFRCDGPPSKFPYLATISDFWKEYAPKPAEVVHEESTSQQ